MRIIADNANILEAFREKINQDVLRPVCVLVFIDEKILEAVLIFFKNVLIVLEQFDGLQQQIVEIHTIAFAQPVLIFFEDKRRPLLKGVFRNLIVTLR